MTDLVIQSAIVAAGQVVLALTLKGYLTTYFGEKGKNLATKEDIEEISLRSERGKNLATKEDIAEITQKVEAVRLEFGSRLHVGHIRYEFEFKTLSELSAALGALCRAVMSMRPPLEFVCANEADEKARKASILETYIEAANDLWELTQYRRPFYPASIHRALEQLNLVTRKEARDFADPSTYGEDEESPWQRAAANREKIEELAEGVIDEMRGRVENWESSEVE